MGEIGIGDFYRTKNGKIHKWSKGITYIGKDEIINHSKQLIDLIKVGDILEIRTGLHSSFKYFVENEDNLLLLKEQVKEFWNIETILTKEQYEQNSYKVGGEDE